MRIQDRIVISGRSGKTIAVSAVAVATGVLHKGMYDVCCDVDCYIRVRKVRPAGVTPDIGEATTDVTAANGYMIYAKNVISVAVDGGEEIGIIAGGAGTFRYHQTGE